MEAELNHLKEQTLQELSGVKDLESLQAVYLKVLGRKGELTGLLRNLVNLSPEERPKIGSLSNRIKNDLAESLEQKKQELLKREQDKILAGEKIDVTRPGKALNPGRLHPLTQTINRIKEIFIGFGFSTAQGPELETEFYNFEALNIPAHHPSRDMWDSFYFSDNLLLRSHTSPVQVRVMEKEPPPLKIISVGRCYRRDAVDATHSWMFHQMEGFMVDQRVSFSDLKGILTGFARELYGQERKLQFIPSYFPFTEPSVEISIDCFLCRGKGCRSCGQSGWLEILGAGMIHPQVFYYADLKRKTPAYDPEKVSGFAFGLGIERIAMLLHGIPDIRLFFENDLRFLEQF